MLCGAIKQKSFRISAIFFYSGKIESLEVYGFLVGFNEQKSLNQWSRMVLIVQFEKRVRRCIDKLPCGDDAFMIALSVIFSIFSRFERRTISHELNLFVVTAIFFLVYTNKMPTVFNEDGKKRKITNKQDANS